MSDGEQSVDEGATERLDFQLYWLKHFFNNGSVEHFLVAVDDI